MRIPALILCAALLAAPAAAQDQTFNAEEEAARIRADFRARFVDYDERLKAMERRIEALEAQIAERIEVPTDASSAEMPAETDAATPAAANDAASAETDDAAPAQADEAAPAAPN